MKNKPPIYVDGGLNNMSLLEEARGQGYAKVNLSSDKRIQLELNSIENTNNESELFAILFGITQCIKNKSNKIYSDSEWCIKAVTGEYKPNEPRLKLMVWSINALLRFYKIEISWVSREQNLAT